ncbi:Fungal specific transcription factor domain [Ceratobasidium sp. AG-Ba]|nr:Fungal specific transcription factor domain [Ceratobasidium sp. AG-Ba]QRW07180.1 Fungal specific transcription factor domain [Ceratobasidium sp. AG-Ba]
MALCGAKSNDARVGRALKKFIKILDRIKHGRISDAFLVIPMGLAGIAAHEKRDREIIRQRMRSVCEWLRSGTYVGEAAGIMKEVPATVDVQARSAVWSDLRFAFFKVAGIA